MELLFKIFRTFLIIYILYNLIYYIIFKFLLNRNLYNMVVKSRKNIKHSKIVNKFTNNVNNLNIEFKLFGKNLISSSILIIFSLLILFVSFIVAYMYIKLFFPAFFFAIFFMVLPYFILQYISNKRKHEILNLFPIYALNLKRYTDISNNIIEAIAKAEAQGALKEYIEVFNISTQNGMNVYDAFDNLALSINIPKITNFIVLLKHCYTTGGNFSNLLEEYATMQTKENLRFEEEAKNSFSSKLALAFLIILNIYVVFGFALNSIEFKDVLTNTFIGRLILDINIISYLIILIIYTNLNKMEE